MLKVLLNSCSVLLDPILALRETISRNADGEDLLLAICSFNTRENEMILEGVLRETVGFVSTSR